MDLSFWLIVLKKSLVTSKEISHRVRKLNFFLLENSIKQKLVECSLLKQEYIPVGCALTAPCRTGRSPQQRPTWTETPGQRPHRKRLPDIDPPGQRPPGQRPPIQRPLDRTPWTETPWVETSLDREPPDRGILVRHPPVRDPPGQRPPDRDPLDRDQDAPCGQTDTCENITFANFVCGR